MISETYRAKLEQQHADLELQIEKENKRPQPDTILLQDLKKQKLRLKEEITRLQA